MKRFCRLRQFALPFVVCAALAGILLAGGERAAAADGQVPIVVVTIKPIHSLVAGVMAEVGAPHLLLEGRASPHSFQLKPSAARLLNSADLIVRVGPTLESPLNKILTSLSQPRKILDLIILDKMIVYKARGGRLDLPSDDGAATGDDGSHDGHMHEFRRAPGVYDPHIWLSIANGKVITRAIAARLSKIDPANRAAYQRGAAATLSRLEALESRLAAQLDRLKGQRYMAFHDAFQYLTRPYGIEFAGAITVDPSLPARAGHMAALRERLTAERAGCVFTEPQYNQKIVRALVEGMKVGTGELDAIGYNVPAGKAAYSLTMSRLATALVDCFG